MFSIRRLLCGVAGGLLVASLATAQGNPTGTISGRVVQQDGAVLPGVTVSATSPALQGARTVTSSTNGDFILPFLPPGDYTVTFELSGFKTIEQTTKVAAAQTVPLDITLDIATVTETITVSAQAQEFSQTAPVASTYRADLVNTLPSDRSLNATILLAPNASAAGPSNNNNDAATATIVIAGAASFENLFLINGVVVNENLRGQASPLFIEDAIQETTITSGSISAEFGRFSGGVVNAITKSGGNNFSGSFRTTLTNDDWRTLSPFQGDRKVDDTIPTYEFTAGGPIVRDRLWFFGAGRFVDRVEARQGDITGIPYDFSSNEKRFEGKGTYSFAPNHTVRGSYIGRRRDEQNARQFNVMDLRSLFTRSLPENLYSANYTGILSTNFFVEGQYSRRDLKFDGSGSSSTDIIDGTLVIDSARATRYWSPTFCSVCADPEERKNEDILLKANYFLSTNRTGSHNLVFGYDMFNDIRRAENHQSGSGYRVLGSTSIIRDGQVYPSWQPGASTTIQWNPITQNSLGTNFRTHSLFVNDTWRMNERVSLNVGIRWDKNDGKDSAGSSVVRDSAFSPRLAITWDPAGNGRWTINGGYGRYVAGIANSVADGGSGAGSPATYQFRYDGPAINPDVNAATSGLVTTDAALRTLFGWFFDNGGTNRTPTLVQLPGVSTRVGGNLVSPSVQELTGGVSRQLGSRALVRADVIYRNFTDFYASRRDLTTGNVLDPIGRPQDLSIIENSELPERKHTAMSLQASYRLSSSLQIAGNYTLSKSWGNFDGETLANGPITAASVTAGSAGQATTGFLFYPEFNDPAWNRPDGDITVDQRHRARVYGVWTTPIAPRFGSLTVSLLHTVNTGQPYGAVGLVSVANVTNPGYVAPPTRAAYYFTDRDAFRTDTINRTDLSTNYAYRFGQTKSELFFQAQIFNLFDRQDIADPNSIILTTQTRTGGTLDLTAFDPFVDTPVEGTHWRRGPGFGDARNRFAYQTPRTLRLSMGIRF